MGSKVWDLVSVYFYFSICFEFNTIIFIVNDNVGRLTGKFNLVRLCLKDLTVIRKDSSVVIECLVCLQVAPVMFSGVEVWWQWRKVHDSLDFLVCVGL